MWTTEFVIVQAAPISREVIQTRKIRFKSHGGGRIRGGAAPNCTGTAPGMPIALTSFIVRRVRRSAERLMRSRSAGMKRAGVLCVVVAATMTIACGGTDNAGSSPTGPSSSSSSSTNTSQPSNSSSVPTNLAVNVNNGVVTLTWNGVNGASEYLVLVGSSSGNSDKLSTNTTNTTYTYTAGSGTYYVRVQAKVNGNWSSSSNEVNFTIS